jgi:hypothetical protein
MLRLLIALLVLSTTTLARADETDTHDGGFDTGAKVAVAGGTAFAALYSLTAISTAVGDSLCGLGEGGSCNNQHGNLYVPLVGGFLNGRDDWSRNLGIASSVLQVTAAGVMVAGLAVHHWRVKNVARAAR